MSDPVCDYHSAETRERLMGMDYDTLNRHLSEITELPDSDRKDGYISLIWEILEEKYPNPCKLSDTEIGLAWEDLCENYCRKTVEKTEKPAPESALFSASSGKKPGKKPLTRILRSVAVAAVIAVFLCCIASAFGYNVLEIFVKQSSGTLVFSNSDKLPSYKTEQHAFWDLSREIERHTDLALVPNYDPKGTTLESLKTSSTAKGILVTAVYRYAEGVISFQYAFCSPTNDIPSTEYQIHNEEATIYESQGTRFYILRNLEQSSIAWVTDCGQCSIWGDFSVEEAMQMVDSLRK